MVKRLMVAVLIVHLFASVGFSQVPNVSNDELPYPKGRRFPLALYSLDLQTMDELHTLKNFGWVGVNVYRVALARASSSHSGEAKMNNNGGANDMNSWAIPLSALNWKALPDEVRGEELPRWLTVLDGSNAIAIQSKQSPYSVRKGDEGVTFEVIGQVPNLRTMKWSAGLEPRDITSYPYFILRYRAIGIARSYSPVAVVSITGRDKSGNTASESLIDVAQVLNDGAWHVVVAKIKAGFTTDSLRVQVSTTDSLGCFELGSITFHNALPEVYVQLCNGASEKRARFAKFECIEISRQFNDSCADAFKRVLDKEGMVTDGANNLGAGRIFLAGIPFLVGKKERNIIKPPENPELNNQPVEFLGFKTTRRYYRPIGRDDTVEVTIVKKVSEVFLILIAELPKGGNRYAIPPGPYDYFADIGALSVELCYDDGDSEFAFPYSLADNGYAIQRMVGVYAVPADPTRVLYKLVLHNHVFGTTFSIAAVTVNTSTNRLLPKLVSDEKPIHVPNRKRPRHREPYIRKDAKSLTIGNSFYDVVINCAQGFSLQKFVNRWSMREIAPHPSSGLEIQIGDTVWTGRAFITESVSVAGKAATIVLRSADAALPLKLMVRLRVDNSPQLTMNLSAVNVSEKQLNADIRFPVLRGISIGSPENTWLFFPRYRVVNTNRQGFFISANDRQFCVQFMDIYNPSEGIGIALLTHNLSNAPLEYALGKNKEGAFGFVQSPSAYTSLPPGKIIDFTETCLIFHSGDWHNAFEAYKDWLATWYKPMKSQNKGWFKRIFVVRSHLTKRAYSWTIPIYDPEKREYKVDEFVKGDTDYLGTRPDMVILGGWCDYDREFGGDYAIKDYTGGVEALRSAVKKFQEEHHIPLTLYMIPDRCSKESEIGKRIGEKIACRRSDGSAYQDEKVWYICPQVKEWQDHFIGAVLRTQQQTGVKAIYIDVFGYSDGWRCYSKEHGHQVPSQADEATYQLIRRIRDALPDDVAIWSEFPLNDYNAQYLDGNIQYYCLYWHEFFGKWHDSDGKAPLSAPFAQSIVRFAFPHLRQFVFLCGMPEWSSDSKFPFFNGEPLFDVSWCLYSDTNLERMRKSIAIQKQFADCFTSAHPIPDVPTEKRGVHANCFPGNNRIIWTLYNSRFTTVRGTVLKVAHRKGASYYDVWNDKPLNPKIINGKAIISLKLDPQGLGCVVQNFERGKVR